MTKFGFKTDHFLFEEDGFVQKFGHSEGFKGMYDNVYKLDEMFRKLDQIDVLINTLPKFYGK